MNPVACDILTQRISRLGNLPAMPAILSNLCESLGARASQISLEEVVGTISRDESLVAQCLRMANSGLYRQRGDVGSIREAVLALGFWRIRDLAFSCHLPLMFKSLDCAVTKENFWRHALATAVIAQKLDVEFGHSPSEQAYLAGLLHEIGLLISAILFPEDFRGVMLQAVAGRAPIVETEERLMGITHTETGRIAAELWRLPMEVSEVIEFHHRPGAQKTKNDLTVIVQAANELCLNNGLGYGYEQHQKTESSQRKAWQFFTVKFPGAARRSPEELKEELEPHFVQARELADQVFALVPAGH